MTDMEMVMRDGLNLEFVKKQTEEICLTAVKQDSSALELVKNQTKDVCLEAVRQNKTVMDYIRNWELRLEVEKML